MINRVAKFRHCFSVGVCFSLSIALQPTTTFAQSFEPICQVGVASGFCHPAMPSTPLIELPNPAPSALRPSDFGTFNVPFAINSLWNIRPRQVVFGNAVIPESNYYPLIGTGPYSTTAFKASQSDAAVIVYPPPGAAGVWDPDAQTHVPSITIPHWPADTVPAAGSDGHADIVDVEQGIIHSFWQLRNIEGRWTATQYAWSRLDGRGWGDGSHYFQGARAAGITSMAGLIRKHEINDGASQYYHALALSLTYNGSSKYAQYVFPATSGDRTWRENTGLIPTGALLMLPPTFDEMSISNLDLRKVVKTLKTYGAYVVDRNFGTPFYIYVENSADFTLHRGGWNSSAANDLQRIRAALRQVSYAKDWVNTLGEPVTSVSPLNMLNMRGPWLNWTAGGAVPKYDSATQSAVFGPTSKAHWAEGSSDRALPYVPWARPAKGKLYEFRVEATNGGKSYLRFWGNGAEQFNTRALTDGQTFRLRWPTVDGVAILGVVSGIGEKTVVRSLLTEVKE